MNTLRVGSIKDVGILTSSSVYKMSGKVSEPIDEFLVKLKIVDNSSSFTGNLFVCASTQQNLVNDFLWYLFLDNSLFDISREQVSHST